MTPEHIFSHFPVSILFSLIFSLLNTHKEGSSKDIIRMMEPATNLHMNGSASGDNSYANNSTLQRKMISKTRPMLERAIIKTMRLHESFPDQCFTMADMGCSYGPNTFLCLSNVIDIIVGLCQSAPELQVFLNDLPTNDFNSVFMSLPEFYKRLLNEKCRASVSCFVSATPGSFYGRLFPSSTLHFVHSSYSLHWLSQVPRGIENNKGNIYIGRTSPQNVAEAYKEQFQTDFSNFLSYRAKEMKPGGGMVLAFIGKIDDPTCTDSYLHFELLSRSLLDMVEEGKIEEGKVDSFNIPIYYPSKREVKEIVERQGSFTIDELHSLQTNDNEDELDEQSAAQNEANTMRAVLESMISSHFGEGVIADLFARYAKHIGDHILMENIMFFDIVISMTKN